MFRAEEPPARREICEADIGMPTRDAIYFSIRPISGRYASAWVRQPRRRQMRQVLIAFSILCASTKLSVTRGAICIIFQRQPAEKRRPAAVVSLHTHYRLEADNGR